MRCRFALADPSRCSIVNDVASRNAKRRTLLRSAFSSRRYPIVLLAILTLWFAVWAIRPWHPDDFFVEHILTALAVPLLVFTYRKFRLSNLSYTFLFLFLSLHVVGAHYTYSEVPWESWAGAVAGWFGVEDFDLRARLGFTRNHFDRFVHLCFGLFCAYPLREIFLRIAQVRGFWGYYLPFDVVLSCSLLYELLEWGVAVVVAGDVGQSYLGTQGDEWDAQKDMFLAMLGAFIATGTAALVNWRLRRDFAAEFAESLRVKDPEPLDEARIANMLEKRE
jgi:putative membrane protein